MSTKENKQNKCECGCSKTEHCWEQDGVKHRCIGCSSKKNPCIKYIPQPTLSQCCNTELYETKHEGKILHYFCSKCGQPFFLQQADTAHMSQKRMPVIEGMQNGVFNAPQQEKEIKHYSDCAVHNEPAYPNGECNCGGYVSPLLKEDWMDKEREAFEEKFKDSFSGGDMWNWERGLEVQDYWISRIQSQIEAERERAFKEGYEKGLHDECSRWMNQDCNAHDNAIRQKERERIVKMIEGMKSLAHEIDGEAFGWELLEENRCCPGDDATLVYENTLDKLLANLTSNE